MDDRATNPSGPVAAQPLRSRTLLSFRAGLWFLAVLIAASVILLVANYDRTLMPNDTAQYLSVARHLLQGDGLKTDLVFFMEHHVQKSMPVQETGFAPGYAILVAGMATLGLPVTDASFVVTCSSFALVPLLLYLLLLRSTTSPLIALSMSALWLCLVYHWFLAWERLSELPFIVATLLTLLLIAHPASDRPTPRLLAGAAAAAALTIRYAGIFFVLSTLLVFFQDARRQRSRSPWLELGTFALAPLLTTLGFFWRNYSVVGDVRGGNVLYQDKTFGSVLGRVAKALQHLSGFTREGFEQFRPAELSVMVLLPITVALLWWHRRSIQFDRKLLRAACRDRSIRIALSYVALGSILYLVVAWTTSMEFEARMLVVLAPFVLLISGSLIRAVRLHTPGARRVVVGLVALWSVVFFVGQRQVHAWQLSRPNLYLLVQEALTARFDHSSVGSFLRESTSTQHPLLGNEPQMLGAVLERPVVGLPPPNYSDRIWTVDAVRATIADYGIEHVVFMPRLQELPGDRVRFFDDLANGVRPPWLRLIAREDRVQLFRVSALGNPAASPPDPLSAVAFGEPLTAR